MADTQPAQHPYTALTPDCVLDALESVGLRPDGRLLALNSYENRVYQVGMEEGQPLIAKFYRPERWSDDAILEEHAFVAELAEREIPVVQPSTLNGRTLHRFESSDGQAYRFALFPRQSGRAPELGSPEILEWMGRFMARIHAVGAIKPFAYRPELTIATFGTESRDWLLAHDFIPPELRDSWQSTADRALEGVAHCFDRAGDVKHLRLHGDCHLGNVLWSDGYGNVAPGPHFVDFDDARMGPAVQDLWMLLSGDRSDMQRQLNDVLIGYGDFFDFDPRELHLVEALRTLRLLHFSAWIARRWTDPAFPAAFPWFDTARYWQERILELREQIALMDEEPLRAY